MLGQTIGLVNDKGSSYSVAMFRPSSNAHHVCLASSSNEVHGASGLATGVGIDQHIPAQESHCHTKLRFNRLSRFASVAELSASIAHQLSQPLTSMLANAQAAKRWLVAGSNRREAITSIDRIVKDVRNANETVLRIRALFKQEPLARRPANISDVLSEAVRLVLEDPRKREVSIRSCFEENLPEVWIDPLAIQELLINLISNAVEALKDTGETALVRIHAALHNPNEMIIQVIDNGSGIGETDQIFDAFVTSKEGGLGIGLALSRSIAEAHGGCLWAENNPSGGATFSLTLPLGSKNEISAAG